MNQQKYYCKECSKEINEYTNYSNRNMCYSCSQDAYYKENERLTAENSKIDEYKCVIDDICEQYRKLETENAKLRHRAEIAERALLNMTKKYNLAERKIATTKDGWFSFGEAQIALLANEAVKQAEKELQEERE